MNRRTVEFRSLDDVLGEIERLRKHGYDRAGNWSLGQVCNHLSQEVDLSLGKPIRWIPRPLQSLMLGSFLRVAFLGKIGTAFGMRLPTIRPQNEPIEDDVGIQRLQENFERLRQPDNEHLHPFHLWHCRHHFSFLIPVGNRTEADAKNLQHS